MPTDRQILSTSVVAAPKNYVVPKNAEFVLKAVNATFADNGAAGDWLPCLTLISDSGDVIARAVDQNVKVTAGGSAEVSWFPGVKPAATTAAAAFSYTRGIRNNAIYGDAAFSAPPGSSAHPFPHLDVSNAAVFAWVTNTNPNDNLHLLKAGLYLLIGASQWEAGTFFHYGQVIRSDEDLGLHGETFSNSQNSTIDPGGAAMWTDDATFLNITAPPATVSFGLFNNDAVNRNVVKATFGAIYLGAAG